MTTNNKGRNSGNRATPKHCKDNANHNSIASTVKGCIVTLALWGLLPLRLANWLIQRGGLSHD